jgi:hypothetical protein
MINTNNLYKNVFKFPEGTPYNINAGNDLVISIINMNKNLEDMNEVFEMLINSLNSENIF